MEQGTHSTSLSGEGGGNKTGREDKVTMGAILS